jgi:Fic family protein
MTAFIHQLPRWPAFHWDGHRIAAPLATVRHQQGRLLGRMESLGPITRQQILLQTLSEDVLKTSEIDGEQLDPEQVNSSIARRLGLDYANVPYIDPHVDGVVDVILDATANYPDPLTADRLFAWHTALFSATSIGMKIIRVGGLRTDQNGTVQAAAGSIGRQRALLRAPAASRLNSEVDTFLRWFQGSDNTDWVIKAAIAHLWLVTIHPFDAGNGRIARAVADLALARSEETHQRFYSISAQIREESDAYWTILEQTQKGWLDITPWLEWFLACMSRAISGAQQTLSRVLARTRFWDSVAHFPLNPRQRLVIARLLDGSEGKLTSGQWAKLANCSHDTSLRDISALLAWGLLTRSAESGRNTSYTLVQAP